MLENAKNEALKVVELACEQLVTGGAMEVLVMELKDMLKKAIPGPFDDMIIEQVVVQGWPKIKAALLVEVEKISADV